MLLYTALTLTKHRNTHPVLSLIHSLLRGSQVWQFANWQMLPHGMLPLKGTFTMPSHRGPEQLMQDYELDI